MARPTLMKLALVIALSTVAGTAGASQISAATAVGAASFSPSNFVTIGVVAGTTQYSANAKHLNGDRTIAFTNSDARLYYSSGCTVGGTVAAPSASDSYSNLSTTSGWNSM